MNILIIDKDYEQRKFLKTVLKSYGYEVFLVTHLKAALAVLDSSKIEVIFIDWTICSMNSIELLQEILKKFSSISVIVFLRRDDVNAIDQAMKVGAFYFLFKPLSEERLIFSLKETINQNIDLHPMSRFYKNIINLDRFVSMNDDMIRVINLAKKASEYSIPVILEGESGVGKQMLARAIHASGLHSSSPFIVVNCRLINREYIEKILFGYREISTRGETIQYVGKFIEANGGTLFIEEPSELPLETQKKLLRAIESSEIETADSYLSSKVDVRCIFSTDKNLVEEVANCRLREDFYYKINVFPIIVPALRKRREDIPYLARTFLKHFCVQNRTGPLYFSSDALAFLSAYNWPGNMRQLENAVFRAAVLSKNFELTSKDFSYINQNINNPALSLVCKPETSSSSNSIFPVNELTGQLRSLSEVEAEMIELALKLYQGHISEVARRLGIGRSTLYRKIKEYNIDMTEYAKNTDSSSIEI
ncbi:hypothetical protein RL73_03040 [Liberibacter crescens]|nr:hypothetical protein RL73_03040 [Liberibacter crescens]